MEQETSILNISQSQNSCNTSLPILRPAPIFFKEPQSLSTKKARGTPKCARPPPAPIKSCPVTRIFPRVKKEEYKPRAVSFKNDVSSSFIEQNSLYSSKKTESYFQQCFIIEKRLGIGSFGEVFQVKSNEDNKLYACKRTLLRFRGDSDRRRRIGEVQNYEALPRHPNCVRFYRAWEERQHLYLLTELCNKSLADIANDKHELPESILWDYLIDLLKGLSHIHKHNLVHMDVKPENIFIGQDGRCKIGDFGLVIDASKGDFTEAIEGDPRYLAPECLQSRFSSSADIFSLGLTILELATDLDLPKQGEQWHLLRDGSLPDVAFNLSLDMKTVLLGLLQPEPSLRLTANSALELPAVKKRIFYKTVKDTFNDAVSKTKSCFVTMWLWMTMAFSAITGPFKHLKFALKKKEKNTKKDNIRELPDLDYFVHSDDELDDQVLARPLNDTTSSSEVNNSKFSYISNMINSTPLLYHSPKTRNRFLHNSLTKKITDTGSKCARNLNEIDLSEIHLELSPVSVNKSIAAENRCQPLNNTSKNLIDLFNAAESDDDDD